jgi:hypothetical protein
VLTLKRFYHIGRHCLAKIGGFATDGTLSYQATCPI